MNNGVVEGFRFSLSFLLVTCWLNIKGISQYVNGMESVDSHERSNSDQNTYFTGNCHKGKKMNVIYIRDVFLIRRT